MTFFSPTGDARQPRYSLDSTLSPASTVASPSSKSGGRVSSPVLTTPLRHESVDLLFSELRDHASVARPGSGGHHNDLLRGLSHGRRPAENIHSTPPPSAKALDARLALLSRSFAATSSALKEGLKESDARDRSPRYVHRRSSAADPAQHQRPGPPVSPIASLSPKEFKFDGAEATSPRLAAATSSLPGWASPQAGATTRLDGASFLYTPRSALSMLRSESLEHSSGGIWELAGDRNRNNGTGHHRGTLNRGDNGYSGGGGGGAGTKVSPRALPGPRGIPEWLDSLKHGWSAQFSAAFDSIGARVVDDFHQLREPALRTLEKALVNDCGARLVQLRRITEAVKGMSVFLARTSETTMQEELVDPLKAYYSSPTSGGGSGGGAAWTPRPNTSHSPMGSSSSPRAPLAPPGHMAHGLTKGRKGGVGSFERGASGGGDGFFIEGVAGQPLSPTKESVRGGTFSGYDDDDENGNENGGDDGNYGGRDDDCELADDVDFGDECSAFNLSGGSSGGGVFAKTVAAVLASVSPPQKSKDVGSSPGPEASGNRPGASSDPPVARARVSSGAPPPKKKMVPKGRSSRNSAPTLASGGPIEPPPLPPPPPSFPAAGVFPSGGAAPTIRPRPPFSAARSSGSLGGGFNGGPSARPLSPRPGGGPPRATSPRAASPRAARAASLRADADASRGVIRPGARSVSPRFQRPPQRPGAAGLAGMSPEQPGRESSE